MSYRDDGFLRDNESDEGCKTHLRDLSSGIKGRNRWKIFLASKEKRWLHNIELVDLNDAPCVFQPSGPVRDSLNQSSLVALPPNFA